MFSAQHKPTEINAKSVWCNIIVMVTNNVISRYDFQCVFVASSMKALGNSSIYTSIMSKVKESYTIDYS